MIKKFKGKTGIDIMAAAKDGAFRGNEDAMAEFVGALNTYFDRAMNPSLQSIKASAIDPNLQGLPDTVLVTQSLGETGLPDFGFRRLFDHLDLTASESPTFDVLDVTNGVTFEQIEDGEESKARKITTAKSSVRYLQ